MTRAEREGLSRIEGRAAYIPPKTARLIVRIYYRSEGGEILCCDSAPLTWVRAEELRASLRGGLFLADKYRDSVSDAVHVEVLGSPPPPHEAEPKFGARLVVLPSQRT